MKSCKMEFRGKKTVNMPERIKEILKGHDWIEFVFEDNKFAIIKFKDFVDLLQSWKDSERGK